MAVHSERRLVTCLFVDVVGSTDATVKLGPERMQRLLRDAFAEMSTTINRYGGTIETYVGDAIFALFGAPVAQADDAERALRAADACARWSSAAEASSARLSVRVGLETGEALVDLAGVDQHQRMAIGECVNIAARLQQQGEPGEIIVGPTCHEATRDVAQFESLGALSLKGLGEVNAWRFTDFGAGEAVQQVAFVGRTPELEALGHAFERAEGGTATLALVVGPPGQGKSRLASEAIHGWSIGRLVRARCRPGAETGSNTPLRQLVNSDVPDATPESVRGRMSALLGGPEGIEVAAAVCHSVGLEVDDRLLAVSRMEQRELIAEAWRRYLAAVARDGVLLAWIEDIHWADPVLLRIIDHVTSDLEASILVIATARPEFAGSAHLRPRENRLQINLEPLDHDAAALLARNAGDGLTDPARGAGNPLFIIELARSRSAADEMPVTIQAAIAARLDELSPAERELLQRASVAGETFDVRDAAVLTEREPHEVVGALGRITHLGFLAPVDSRYRFHHALVREVAYGRLPVAERMALHARYAVEGVDPTDVEALAHHWWEAVKPADADWVWEEPGKRAALRREGYRAHLAAGLRLEARNAYEEALDVYRRAIDLADAAPEIAVAEAAAGLAAARQGRGDEAWQHRLRAIDQFALGGSAPAELYADMLEIATLNWGYFEHLPDQAEVHRLLDVGEQAARAQGDDVALVRLLMERAAFTNDLAGADEIMRFVESPDAVRFADPAHRMAQVLLWNGQIDRAIALYHTVFDRLVPGGAFINEPEALLWYSVTALHAGDMPLADALAARLADVAAHRSAHTRQHLYGLRALLQMAAGNWADLAATTDELTLLVESNPDTGFCILGAAAAGYGAIGDVAAGRSLPEGLDAFVARLIPESTLIQAGSLMVPRVMAGQDVDLQDAFRSYAADVPLWDRQWVWDIGSLMPAVALTMLERWDELGPSLAQLDEFAAGGSRLAAATAAAIREELAAAKGGPAPNHDELRALGCAGISQLIRFRPTSRASA